MGECSLLVPKKLFHFSPSVFEMLGVVLALTKTRLVFASHFCI